MAAIEVDPDELRAAAYAVARAVAAVDLSMPRGGSGLARVDEALSAFAALWSAAAHAWARSVLAVADTLTDAADSYDAVDTSVVPEASR